MGKGRAPPDIRDLLAEWQGFARVQSRAHRRAAVTLERRHYWQGVPATILSAVVGTAIFATLDKAAASLPLKLVLGGISIFAAALAGLQTFFRYLERAGEHNVAYAEYDDIARSIDLVSTDTRTREDWGKALTGLGQRLEAVQRRAPIPHDVDALEREAKELAREIRVRLTASVGMQVRSRNHIDASPSTVALPEKSKIREPSVLFSVKDTTSAEEPRGREQRDERYEREQREGQEAERSRELAEMAQMAQHLEHQLVTAKSGGGRFTEQLREFETARDDVRA